MATPSPSYPSGPIITISGTAVVVRGDDIDTDRIIPARFLRCVTFEGLGEQVFADDRAELQGQHPFDRPEHQGANLLLVNRNFGCGSSREHAPQALMRWGIRAVVGESFAEIFYGNCLALGIPCLTAPHAEMLEIQQAAAAAPSGVFELDVAAATLEGAGERWALELPVGPRQMLTTGQWDATGQLLSHGAELDALVQRLPYLNGFKDFTGSPVGGVALGA
ncbi:3-isopropylmalate dehydratase, small subunit [Cyanobium sp. PCC 7001]|uniref:3-isopropylmalate dehydratase small subunit n=1 Tax=Cyanobium sp. PCC 7001 TaxID=180281 RepID=UPI0001804B3E|nr:3-isopropylmalate dehydratase small subunit [Cyanobium sp. PCC 7001]EDY39640.1 3-isopropylmalate dehydratase, small subunit [Cyanobium sp. PCC 7001]